MNIKALDPSTLAEQVANIVSADRPQKKKLNALLQFTVSIVNGAGAFFYQKQADVLNPVGQLLSRQAETMSEDIFEECAASARAAIQDRRASITPLSKMPSASIISCPVPGVDNVPDSCLSVLVILGSSPKEPFLVILQLLASILSLSGTLCDKSASLNSTHELLSSLIQLEIKSDVRKFVDVLKQWFNASQVAVGYGQRGGKVRLKSVSDVVKVDPRTSQARLFINVMQDCLQHTKSIAWSSLQTESMNDESLLVKELVQQNGMQQGFATVLPGVSGKAIILALLWSDTETRKNQIEDFKRVAPLLGMMLQTLLSSDSGPSSEPLKSKRLTLKRVTAVSVLTFILALFTFYPVPFNLHADCQVVPVQIRYIVSQFDGLLNNVLVEPGDMVKQNDQLALLDGRELELELRSIEADSAKALKVRDNHVASGNVAAAQIDYLEYQRLQERAELLHIRQQQLNLVSPVDGIVLSGDLKRAIGGPVSKGQALFEVAPLETVVIELAIADDDISHVKEKAPVIAHFNAFPGRDWRGTISHIAPKSELFQGQNSFIVSFQIINSDNLLQPGMQGQASVDSGRKSLLWIYFHKPWYALVRMLHSLL